MDEMEARIAEVAAREELASLRPEIDGQQVMELLGVPAGPAVGVALEFLMDIRLEEGILGEAAIVARLREWWAINADDVSKLIRTRRVETR